MKRIHHLFTLRIVAVLVFCFAISSLAYAQTQVKGRVVDEGGEPLPGVSVIVAGTRTGTSTDLNGDFSLSMKVPGNLEIVCVGYASQTVRVTGAGRVDVVLKVEDTALTEAVVVGYGTQKKASVVGSVQSVVPVELKASSSNLTTSFAGRMAGVIAVQRSGEPGADGADFWIRGISTFNATSPLIIIDGVQSTTSDLDALDPEVIAGFSILKDATATALYGMRGANGVMIVTTKSGQESSKPVVNVRFETVYNNPTYVPKFVDGVTYMNMYNESLSTRGTTDVVPYGSDKIRGTSLGGDPYVYPNVDWYDTLFKKGSTAEEMNINVRGGGKVAQYFSNFSFNNENGMLRNSDEFSYNTNINVQRFTFQNDIDVNITKTTKMALHMNVILRNYNGPATSASSLFGLVTEVNPVDFPIRYPDDDNYTYILWGGKSGGAYNNGYRNPYAEMAKGYSTSFSSTLNTNLTLEQDFNKWVKGLKASGLISFRNYTSSDVTRSAGYNQFEVDSYVAQEDGSVQDMVLRQVGSEQTTTLSTSGSNSGDRRIYIQTMLNYDRVFAEKHNVGAMLLYSQDQYNTNTPGSLFDALPQRKQGFAGRLTYSYDYRYMLEANFGYNGSESFARKHRWGFFPSVGLAYNVSREKFFQPISHIVTNLKLRGSWGLVGNDNSATRFTYLSDISLQDGNFYYQTGKEMNYTLYGPNYRRFANNNIGWETGEKINLGIDLSLFGNLNIMADVFREHRRDIFMTRQSVPDFLGTQPYDRWSNFTTTVYGNLGEVLNKGVDFSVDYSRRFGQDFYISAKVNFTYAHNEVLAYDEPDYQEYPNLSIVGHSLNTPLLYQAERLFIDDEEVAAIPTQKLGGVSVSAGDIKYTDIAGASGQADGQIDANDRVYSGNPTVPEIVYGFGISAMYKKVDFSIFFQGAGKYSIMMEDIHPFGTDGLRSFQTFIADDYWSEDNQNIYAKYPRLSKKDNSNNTVASTYWQRDGKYLKLKNVEIGYNFPRVRVYLRGTNLLTFSPFKYWDPEQGSGSGLFYPTQRMYNVGIQVSFK